MRKEEEEIDNVNRRAGDIIKKFHEKWGCEG